MAQECGRRGQDSQVCCPTGLKIILGAQAQELAGGSIPNREDSIILSFEKMRKIIDIDADT